MFSQKCTNSCYKNKTRPSSCGTTLLIKKSLPDATFWLYFYLLHRYRSKILFGLEKEFKFHWSNQIYTTLRWPFRDHLWLSDLQTISLVESYFYNSALAVSWPFLIFGPSNYFIGRILFIRRFVGRFVTMFDFKAFKLFHWLNPIYTTLRWPFREKNDFRTFKFAIPNLESRNSKLEISIGDRRFRI